jgi:hypothetical protein
MTIGQGASFLVPFAVEIAVIFMALTFLAVVMDDATTAFELRPRMSMALLADAIRYIVDLAREAYRRTTRTTVWGVMIFLGSLLGRNLLRHS